MTDDRQDTKLSTDIISIDNKLFTLPINSPVRFEDILRRLGPLTRWTVYIFLVANLPGFIGPFNNIGIIFYAYTPDHWCAIPNATAHDGSFNASKLHALNWTNERLKNLSIPHTERGEFDKCRIYVRDYSDILSVPFSEEKWGSNGSEMGITRETMECTEWNYDQSQMHSSIVTQWDLVCSSTAWKAFAKSAYLIGMFFGSVIYGYLSDRFGRRKTVLISGVQYLASSILQGLSPTYAVFFLIRLSSGMGGIAVFLCGYILVGETVAPEIRGVIQMISQVVWSVGMVALPGVAYFLRDWSMLNIVGGCITSTLLVYIWIFPESPRWLILQGRLEEAKAVLQHIKKINRNTNCSDAELNALIQQCYDNMKKEDSASTSSHSILLDLFRSGSMRKNTIICCYLWTACASGYYGLSLSSPSFGSNLFLMVLISGITDVPTSLFGSLAIQHMKRITAEATFLLLAGSLCLVYLFASPQSWPWLGPTIALTGRFFVALAFWLVHVVTAEIFPTGSRNAAMGLCSTIARVGAALAPFIIDFLDAYDIRYDMIIFGVLLIAAGLSCFLLKETGDKSLPETEFDVKNLDDLLLSKAASS